MHSQKSPSATHIRSALLLCFVAVCVFTADLVATATSTTAAPTNKQPKPKIPSDLRWEPSWREKGDCGPVSLYVLMCLLDRDVSLENVKRVIPFDAEQGCSLEALLKGAEQLGFPGEIRFVNPNELKTMQGPYIIHKHGSLERGTGHFTPIVTYSSGRERFAIINTDLELLGWSPEANVLNGFSGYVFVPKLNPLATSRGLLGGIFVGIGLTVAILTYARSRMGGERTREGYGRGTGTFCCADFARPSPR